MSSQTGDFGFGEQLWMHAALIAGFSTWDTTCKYVQIQWGGSEELGTTAFFSANATWCAGWGPGLRALWVRHAGGGRASRGHHHNWRGSCNQEYILIPLKGQSHNRLLSDMVGMNLHLKKERLFYKLEVASVLEIQLRHTVTNRLYQGFRNAAHAVSLSRNKI